MDVDIFRTIILANELGNDERLVCKFSLAVSMGLSGYSFGVCQFDVNNNPYAILCLRECEFTTDEIQGLKDRVVALPPLDAKLADHAEVVAAWDQRQLAECLTYPLSVCRRFGVEITDKGYVMYHLADYHNQFYLSKGGKMHKFLMGLGRPVTPRDILDFKLGLAWGVKRPDDVYRRYNNIQQIVGGVPA